DLDPRLASREQNHPACVAEDDCGADVSGIEDVLDGQCIRPMTLDQLGDSGVNLTEPLGKRIARAGPDDPAFYQAAGKRSLAGDAFERRLQRGAHITPCGVQIDLSLSLEHPGNRISRAKLSACPRQLVPYPGDCAIWIVRKSKDEDCDSARSVALVGDLGVF